MIKKIKLAFIAAAIVLAVGGAYATKPALACDTQPQYYYNGSGYVAAGTYGVNYFCISNPTTCTYYKPNPISQPNVYAPCRTGSFSPVF